MRFVARTSLKIALIGWGLFCAAPVMAQQRPFSAGEVLSYDLTIGNLGRGGVGSLRVEAAEDIRGEPVEQVRFDFHNRVGPFNIEHHSRSHISLGRFTSLAYQVSEKTPLGTVEKDVQIFPENKRWEGAHESGVTDSIEPLDELSFIYALRAMKLAPGDIYKLARHYDSKRKPAKVRVLRREPIRVPAGEFSAIVVELEVDDPDRYGGKGLLRLFLSDDARRLPLRIESKVPVAGQLTLQLRSYVLPAEPRVEVVP